MTDPRQWGRGDIRRITTGDFPDAVVALVDQRQGGRFCHYCRNSGLSTPHTEPLEFDHLQPLSKGGDNHHLNLVWACRAHNRGRSNRKKAPRVPTWARKKGRRRPR